MMEDVRYYLELYTLAQIDGEAYVMQGKWRATKEEALKDYETICNMMDYNKLGASIMEATGYWDEDNESFDYKDIDTNQILKNPEI